MYIFFRITIQDRLSLGKSSSILTQFTNKGQAYEFLYIHSSLLVKCQGIEILQL